MSHTCFLYFVRPGGSFLKHTSISNPFKKLPRPEALITSSETNGQFIGETRRSVDFLGSQRYFDIRPLEKDEIEYLTVSYFNGFYDDRFTDTFQTGTGGYQIGKKQVGCYAIRMKGQLPDLLTNCVKDEQMSARDHIFYKGLTDSFGLKFPCDHIVNQFFFKEDNHVLKKELMDKQQQFFGARGFSRGNALTAQKISEHLEELETENSPLVGTHFNICFMEEEKAFPDMEKTLSTIFKNLNMMPYCARGNSLAYLFNMSYFGHVPMISQRDIFRVKMEEAVCLITQTSNYKDDGKGVRFNDRTDNVPIYKDIWDAEKKRINARNFFIIAPTGEGKSFLANHIFSQLHDAGYKLVIFDLGGSYEKLSMLFQKEKVGYIKYEEGMPLGINPFLLEEKVAIGAVVENRLSIEKQNELIDFIWRLWKRRARDPENDKQQSVSIRKLLLAYYGSLPQNPSFPDFYTFIASGQNSILERYGIDAGFFEIEEFLHVCSEFIGKGAYSFLFEGTEKSYHVKDKDLVIFELDAAKDDPLLLSILLQMGAETVRQLIWQDRSVRGVVFFDEFAKLLKHGTLLASVEYYAQAIRKQTGALGLVLQSPNQLPQNATASSIIDNTQVLYVLKANSYDDIVERFKLSSHDKQQMYSISNRFSGEERYSEFLLRIGNESNVMRLQVPEAVRLAYMTEGEENTRLMALYKKIGDMRSAIQKYMEDEKDTVYHLH
jgi:type IV secretory pathway VirB4 component